MENVIDHFVATRQAICLFFVYRLIACLGIWAAHVPLAQADWRADTGYNRLATFLGSALPTGNGVPISMVEAGGSNPPIYFPDTTAVFFSGSTDPFNTPVDFIDGSGKMDNGISAHATNVVAGTFIGNTGSVAPGANTITVYEANLWLTNQLKATAGNPQMEDFRVQNFSWVGSFANDMDNPTPAELTKDVAALRRFDFMISRDNVTAVVGLNNGATTAIPRLMAQGYNSIAVGRSDGQHSTGLTNLTAYGPGRSKPDIVAPIGVTSASTAAVSSVATFLHEVVAGTDAAQSPAMKAILMAGADKNEPLFASWTRTPTAPLDPTYGAGEVNIYDSYLITQGGQFLGSQSASTPVGNYGWDFETIDGGSSNALDYLFSIPAGSTAKELSILLTWDVDVPANFNSQTLANLDLELRDSTGELIDQSISTVDNVEHIYLTDLAAGDYTLTVSSDMTHEFGLAWRTLTSFDVPSADFDGDGDVDGHDFLTWQRGYGTLLNAPHAQGDADGDGDVDSDDYLLFQAQFNPAISISSLAAVAVPEPATGVMATVIAVAYWGLRRKRLR